MPIYEFGAFTLNPAERQLTREGQTVPLNAKAFDILYLLIQKSGSLVSKDELMQRIWPHSTVEENNLTVSMTALRKALGDEYKIGEYVETVIGHGYRFVAKVRKVQQEDTCSLAVLPFKNGTGDPALDYLCDGITESLINSLAQLPSLKVLSRSTILRYGKSNDDPLAFARKLDSHVVLAGRVVEYGGTLVLSIELIDVADGTQIWGERYDRAPAQIFPVLEDVAHKVSEKLHLQPARQAIEQLTKRYTNNTEAYHLYLKGRYCWNKYSEEWIKKSIKYFQQAIDLDPHYALAYAGMADAYYRLSSTYMPPKEALAAAKAATARALEIDEEMAEAHVSMGMARLYYDHDWAGAAREYKRAIELKFNLPLAHHRYGTCLMYAGHFREAFAELEIARDLDPLSLQISVGMGTYYHITGQHERAVQWLEKTLELDPTYYPAHVVLGWVTLHNPTEALRELKLAFKFGRDYLAFGFMGYAYAVSGNKLQAWKLLKKLLDLSKRTYVSPYCIAIIYAGLGKKEQAFEMLEKLYEERDEFSIILKVAPELESIRSDLRFKALLTRVGLEH